MAVASDEDLEDRVRRLKQREADANQQRAQYASQRAVREDRLAQLEEQLRVQFGANTPDEALARLAELRTELEGTLREAEQRIGEVSSSAG